MNKQIFLFASFFVVTISSFSQEKIWKVNLFSFFDNIEFGGSEVKVPQTMAGVMVAPEAGFRWDSVHRVSIGVNLMHEFGSTNVVENFYPTAYYNYSKGYFSFFMGAFPKDPVTKKYPRLFFQDSVYYYRPNIEGVSLEYRKEGMYANIWLDWTGRQATDVHESFFAGMSAKYTSGIFYLRHYGYMYHFAGKKDPVIQEALHDNFLFHTSAGIDLSGQTFFDRLELNAGWVIGLERARADNTGWIKMPGVLIETGIEYKGFGVFNSFYSGKGLMYFYGDHDTDLYWGDPAYRSKNYNRTDLYYRFFWNRRLSLEVDWSLHFLESRIYNEQMLKVNVALYNL